jgi:alkanesulfonate monooxygenase SsuD/methylene tetrahydromethanopterin reductase-like flavin-dependent oxidoreductase (luciferase family)
MTPSDLADTRRRSPRLVLVLSENWTLIPARDLRALVRVAIEAEDAGIDTVMLSEHVVLGRSSGSEGVMRNPRDYAAPGNQDPAMPWPDSLVLASAIAGATSKLRIALAAVIFPLRHPLLLAKQLGTLDLLAEGRLIVQPTVSWHEGEYTALSVPFHQRGAILDEQLEAMAGAWRDTPASFEGKFFSYRDVYVAPKPFRSTGPRMWFGGQSLHPPLLRRIVKYASGFHPFGTPTRQELADLREALVAAGRNIEEFEMVGGIRPVFPDDQSVADLARACESIPEKIAQGYNSICFKPSMYTDDLKEVGRLCRDLVRRVNEFVA